MLRFFTKMTAVRSSKKLALSFNDMEPDRVEQVVVVPPLIRQEVTAIQPEEGNYIHGYMVNAGLPRYIASQIDSKPAVLA